MYHFNIRNLTIISLILCLWGQVLGIPNPGQDEKDTTHDIHFQSVMRHIPTGMGHFEDTLIRGVIGPRNLQTVTVTDISDCPFDVGEPSAAVSQPAPTNIREPNVPSSLRVGGEPSNFPSGFDVTAPGSGGTLSVDSSNPSTTILSVSTPTAIDPGPRPTTLHVNPAPPTVLAPPPVRPPVGPPVAISRNGNSTITAGNATITPSDPSSLQNSTSTQDPPSSLSPISSNIASSTYTSSSTTIPIAVFPSNFLGNPAAAVNPAPPPNPNPATSSSVVVDPASSQNVASTPNNGSIALRARAVETSFERLNWTRRNSLSIRLKAQITARALPTLVNRDQDPTTVTQGAVVCVIIPQIVADSPPSSPSTSYIGAALPIPHWPSPPAPVRAPAPATTYLGDVFTSILPVASAPASPEGSRPAPVPAPAPTTTYLGDVFTSILPVASAPTSPEGSPPRVKTVVPGFIPPHLTPIKSVSSSIISAEPASLTTILKAMGPLSSFFGTEPVATVTVLNTDGQPISTRVVDAAPTTITELNSDGQPTATITLDRFTTIVDTNSAGQIVSVVVNDPIATLTELDQSGQPTATIITNVPLTTITIYDSSGVPISTRIAAATGQSDLVPSNPSVMSGPSHSGSSKGAQSTITSTRIITISLDAPTPMAATTSRHSGAGRSVENNGTRLSFLLVVLGGFLLGGLF